MGRKARHGRKYKVYFRIAKGKGRQHDQLVYRIFQNPELLGIEGITSKSVVYKEIEPEIDRRPLIDLLIVYTSNHNYTILLAEAKMSIHKGLRKGDYQLKKARNFYSKFYRDLLRKIQKSGIVIEPEHKVYIDTIIFTQDFTREGIKVRIIEPLQFRREKRFLGLADTGANENST